MKLTFRTGKTLLLIMFVIVGAFLILNFGANSQEGSSEKDLMESMQIVRIMEEVKAPDFILPDLQGKSFRLSDLRGKVVLVNFWTTW